MGVREFRKEVHFIWVKEVSKDDFASLHETVFRLRPWSVGSKRRVEVVYSRHTGLQKTPSQNRHFTLLFWRMEFPHVNHDTLTIDDNKSSRDEVLWEVNQFRMGFYIGGTYH